MNGKYKLYKEYNFGVARFEPGLKSFEEIIHLAIEMRKDKDFPEILYTLTDLRGITFDFDVSKINEMVQMVESYKDVDNQLLGVYVIDDPKATAYVQLFFKSLKYNRDFCSTIERVSDLG